MAAAANCATSLTESGNERISSTKLTPAISVTPARNHGYSNPKNALHTHAPIRKIMPPPLNTIVECDDLWFGLSIMLNLSASLRYTNSINRRIRNMIP